MGTKDDHRAMLDNRRTPLHLYQLTPKTNCQECGFATCLAFATQAIVGQADLDQCSYLDPGELEPFRQQLARQLEAGIGVKREGFEKALQFLRQEVKKWDFGNIASSLGAELEEGDSGAALKFSYFGRPVRVAQEDIAPDEPDGGPELDPYEKILIYNYVIGGAAEPSGQWIGMESLPNSVSKIKSLRGHCEGPLAQAFAGKVDRLPGAVAGIGHRIAMKEEKADFAAEFPILPRLSLRLLWWDEDPSEGFAARVKFLFDSKVLDILDLESLLFTCEQLTDRLLDAAKQVA
ncbi:MAG: DUF3786 domain-containing protein [Syntrophobacteraceae bacterium]